MQGGRAEELQGLAAGMEETQRGGEEGTNVHKGGGGGQSSKAELIGGCEVVGWVLQKTDARPEAHRAGGSDSASLRDPSRGVLSLWNPWTVMLM